MARLDPTRHLHHTLHLAEQFLLRPRSLARIGQPRGFVAIAQQVVRHQLLVDLGEFLLREAELLGRHVPHRFQLLAKLWQAGLQFGMAEAMALATGQIEQVGDLLGVDAKHRRVLHPVGSSHHSEHPLRCRNRADGQVGGQVGGRTLRGLPRFRHDHARPVAEELQRVSRHGVERLDAALVQHGQGRGGTPVMAPLARRSIVGGHQAEQSHDRQRDERHDQIRGRRRRSPDRNAVRRCPFPGTEGRPPLIAALRRLAVVR